MAVFSSRYPKKRQKMRKTAHLDDNSQDSLPRCIAKAYLAGTKQAEQPLG